MIRRALSLALVFEVTAVALEIGYLIGERLR